MLALDDTRWSELVHAYGPADGIPELLMLAAQDFSPGHLEGSPWFDLWGALCHQGDTYTASYGATPHLVALAQAHLDQQNYSPLFLAACIELGRLEGKGPSVPEDLKPEYERALALGQQIAARNVNAAWDTDSSIAIRVSLAAFGGNVIEANSLLALDGA